jgi:tetratricopeptide (TPR) repeat protein
MFLDRTRQWLKILEMLLAVTVMAMGMAAYFRWPPRRRREPLILEIEAFQSLNAQGKISSTGFAVLLELYLRSYIFTDRRKIGPSSPVSFIYSPPPGGEDIEIKGVKIPARVFRAVRHTIEAREVFRIRGVVDEISSGKLIRLDLNGDTFLSVEVPEGRFGVDVAILEIADHIARVVDPILLAQWYWSRQNYLPAIQVYRKYIAKTGSDPKIEFALAQVELSCDRTDSALARLNKLDQTRLPELEQKSFSTLKASIHFSRGEYADCELVATKALKQSPAGEEAGALYSLQAKVSMCNRDYVIAARQWLSCRNALVEELCARLSIPEWRRANWDQLQDELGSVSENKYELFNIVWSLCEAYLSQGLCLQRVQLDANPEFFLAMEAVRAMNLVGWGEIKPGTPRHLGARIHRAYASTVLDRGAREHALRTARTWEVDAIKWLESERQRQGQNFGVLTSLAWSYFGEFQCLSKLGSSATKEEVKQKGEALETCRNTLLLINIPERHYEAEIAFVNACISAEQTDVAGAVNFLKESIRKTRSTETRFSSAFNRARLDEDLDSIRSEQVFIDLVYPAPQKAPAQDASR